MNTLLYHGHFLGIVAYDRRFFVDTVESLHDCEPHNLWRGHAYPWGDGLNRSRNDVTSVFLRTSCEFLLFIDADVRFTPADVMRLREHPEAQENIICGLYHQKTLAPKRWAYNSLPGGDPEPNAKGLMEIARGATGFMQIPRKALTKIRAAAPELDYHCEHERAGKHAFWIDAVIDCDVTKTRRLVGEDWHLCARARAAGVKIYADTRVRLGHIGTAEFPITAESLALAARV